jgi:hypothetical protein
VTDKPTATDADAGADQAPQWRVDGAAAPEGEQGLSDTVVRIPPIRDDTPPPKPFSALPRTDIFTSTPAAATAPAEVVEPTAPVPPGSWAPPVEPVAAAAAASVAAAAAAEAPAVRPAAPRPKSRRTRKARLRLSRLDPWSVMKTVFLFSIAFGIMLWVGTYVTWTVVQSSGLFESVNEQIQNIFASPNDSTPFRIEDYISTNKVLGVAALFAVINVVLMTAIGTLFAFLYNLSANILGGLELTLAED